MAKDNQILIDLKVDGNDALKATIELTDRLNQLKAARKDLEKQMKQDPTNKQLKEQYALLNAEIGGVSKTLNNYKNELANIVKANEAENESLKKLQATLAVLTNQWDRMSKAERESAKGQELKQKIDETYESVTNLEQSTGRFQRNVGNYKSALDGAAVALKGMGMGANGAISGIQNLGAAFKALVSNPYATIIAAIVVVLNQLRKAFKENDDAGTNLSRAFTAFQPILDAVKNAFSLLADVLGKVALGVSKVYRFFYDMLIPGYKDAAKAAEDLVIAEDKLQDKQREATVENAKNNKKIAENNAKLAQKNKYDAAERIKMLNENAKLEKQNMERTKANAAEEYRIALEQSKRKRKLSDEDKDRLSDLEAAMIQAETDYQNSLVSINKKTSQAIKEIENEKIQAEKEAAEKRKAAAERYKQQQEEILQLRRSIEDNMVASMNEGTDKQLKAAKLAYDRQIEDYKKAMKEKPYLTKYYNQLILQEDARYQNESVQIIKKGEEDKRKIREQIVKSVNDKSYQNLLNQYSLLEDGFDKREKLRLLNLSKEKQASFDNEKAILKDFQGTEEEKLKIQDQYAEERRLLDVKYLKERENDIKTIQETLTKNFEKSIQDIIGSQTISVVRSQVDAMIAEQDRLLTAQQISLEQYTKNIENINQTAQNAIKGINLQTAKEILRSMQNAISGVQSLMNEVAGDNERLQKFMKALALTQIGISTSISIMNAIEGATAAGAASGPAAFATTPIFIAELVGIVTSALASSIAVLKKTTTPNVPKFAEGGLVVGQGTSTSDSINAKLSNGEYVIKADTVNKYGVDFFDSLNGSNKKSSNYHFANGGLVANQQSQSMLMEQMADMLQNISPIVSVKEISNLQNRVRVKEQISRY